MPSAHRISEPIESKVTAASVTAAVTGLVLWVFDTFVFYYGSLPEPVAAVLTTGVLAATTGLAGYAAPHTHRPGDSPIGPVESPPADDTEA